MLINAKVVDGNLRCLRSRSESGSSTANPCKQRNSLGTWFAGQGWKTKPDLFHCPLTSQSHAQHENRLRKPHCNELIYLKNYCDTNCSPVRRALHCRVSSTTPLCSSCPLTSHYWGHLSSFLEDSAFTLVYYLLKSLAVEIQECSRKVSH